MSLVLPAAGICLSNLQMLATIPLARFSIPEFQFKKALNSAEQTTKIQRNPVAQVRRAGKFLFSITLCFTEEIRSTRRVVSHKLDPLNIVQNFWSTLVLRWLRLIHMLNRFTHRAFIYRESSGTSRRNVWRSVGLDCVSSPVCLLATRSRLVSAVCFKKHLL